MTTTTDRTSVRKSVVVSAPPQRAFDTFVEAISRWWPPSHHIGKAALKAVVIEPRVGGRWYEVGDDGTQCDWGKVLAWEPPARLLLGWQLDASFRYDPGLLTEVEVRFTPAGDGTRVDLEHRHLDRFGADMQKMSASFGGANGWQGILAGFAEAVGVVRST